MKRITVAMVIFISAILFYSHLIAQEKSDYPKKPAVYGTEAQILVCTKAFEALGKIGDPHAKDVLINGLKSKEYIVKSSAVEALGILGCKEAVPLLRGLINDENYLVKIECINALARLGEPGMEDLLLTFLTDKNAAVRTITVEKLGDFGAKYSSKLFEILSKEDSYVVREKVIQVLGNNKFLPATEYIIRALEDSDPDVRRAACEAIFNVKDKKEAIPLLKNKLNDTDVSVRAKAKELLSLLGEKSITKHLWQETEDKNPLIKSSSYVALANLKDINILPILLSEVVKSENPSIIKREAARALTILKPHVYELVGKELSKLKDNILSMQNLDFIYKVNEKSLPLIFMEALKNPQNPLHQDAPFILGGLRDPVSLPALREALSQDNHEIVASAAFVLGNARDKDAVDSLIQVCRKYGF